MLVMYPELRIQAALCKALIRQELSEAQVREHLHKFASMTTRQKSAYAYEVCKNLR